MVTVRMIIKEELCYVRRYYNSNNKY